MSDLLPSDEMEEILREFSSEAREILDGLDEDMVQLERDPENRDLLNRIFRAMHTLKGNSSFLGLTKMRDLAHEAENLLNLLRNGELRLTADLMDGLLAAVDTTKTLLAEIQTGEDRGVDIAPAVGRLARALARAQAGQEDAGPEAREEGRPREAARHGQVTIRVEIGRLDHLMNLVGELVIGRNRLQQVRGELEGRYENEELVGALGQVSTQIGFVTAELQEAILKTRMVPIRNVFNRFPRVVRDLARDHGKAVDLLLFGHETELDRSVIEEIWDPLVHLIRNSVDHGIENPEERRANGKPAKGRITMTARHSGDHIIIVVEDDGRGIDPARVLEKAHRLGLVPSTEGLPLAEIYNLIFAPGFSTSEEVTDISGRGVGLDVVRTNLKTLGGLIEVSSAVGRGTRFTLKIPLTLAIVQALLVRVEDETAAIPLTSVVETVRLHPEEIHTIRGREVVRLRDRILPLIWLHRVFGRPIPHGRRFYAIVVGLAEERVALGVDGLLGQQEVVVKSIGTYLGAIQGLAGATIMGDGRVVVILDIAGLMESVRPQGAMIA